MSLPCRVSPHFQALDFWLRTPGAGEKAPQVGRRSDADATQTRREATFSFFSFFFLLSRCGPTSAHALSSDSSSPSHPSRCTPHPTAYAALHKRFAWVWWGGVGGSGEGERLWEGEEAGVGSPSKSRAVIPVHITRRPRPWGAFLARCDTSWHLWHFVALCQPASKLAS